MDLTTLMGFATVLAIAFLALQSGGVPAAFLNFHGVMIVGGGVGAAMLINTPLSYLVDAVQSLGVLLGGGRYQNRATIIAAVVSLAEQVQARGQTAFQ